MRKFLFILVYATIQLLQAQTGELKGIVTESDGKTPIPFANVMVEQDGKMILGQSADIDGNYWFKNIEAGSYYIKFSSAGLPTLIMKDVIITADTITLLSATLQGGVTLSEYTVSSSKIKIDPDNTTEGGSFMRRDISMVPSVSSASIVSVTSGVYTRDGASSSFAGSRSDATVFVDGIKVRSSDSPAIITGGIPAKHDDVKETEVIDKIIVAPDAINPILKLGNQLTAGEISDFTKYHQWTKLLETEFKPLISQNMMATGERYLVMVSNPENIPVPFATVQLFHHETLIWQTVTDNTGKAELWTGLSDVKEKADGLKIIIRYGHIQAEIPKPRTYQKGINFAELKVACESKKHGLEIAFVVDATGSMSDEIAYLKDDLTDILQKSTSKITGEISYASVFYRDKTDSYLTRKSDFTSNLTEAIDFIKLQSAGEGGDFPEAVDKGLEEAVNLTWSKNENTKIIFLLLDAPPHAEHDKLLSIRKSIIQAANKGIRIVPVICSGADKNLEFMMRTAALLTNGTYLFLTDDSGIGDAHLKPSTDKYDVYTLNQLMTNIIERFTLMPECNDLTDTIPVTENIMDYLNRPDENTEMGDSTNMRNDITMEVIPNPFPIETDIILNKRITANISVFDMNGKLLLTDKITGNNQYHLNMEQFTHGTYFAIMDAPGKRIVKKIIKH